MHTQKRNSTAITHYRHKGHFHSGAHTGPGFHNMVNNLLGMPRFTCFIADIIVHRVIHNIVMKQSVHVRRAYMRYC